MAAYRNVGHAIRFPYNDGPDTVRRFGDPVIISERQAEELIKGDTPLLPEDLFQSIGFTEDELKNYASPGSWPGAPESFVAKLKAAWIALHEYREALKGA